MWRKSVWRTTWCQRTFTIRCVCRTWVHTWSTTILRSSPETTGSRSPELQHLHTRRRRPHQHRRTTILFTKVSASSRVNSVMAFRHKNSIEITNPAPVFWESCQYLFHIPVIWRLRVSSKQQFLRIRATPEISDTFARVMVLSSTRLLARLPSLTVTLFARFESKQCFPFLLYIWSPKCD